MQIHTTAWHYRYLLWWNDGKPYKMPRTLCTYVWSLVAAGLLPGLVACLAVVLVWAIILYWQEALVVLGVLAVVLGVIVWATNRPHREPTLVGAWLSAKKRKLCPFVEYVD